MTDGVRTLKKEGKKKRAWSGGEIAAGTRRKEKGSEKDRVMKKNSQEKLDRRGGEETDPMLLKTRDSLHDSDSLSLPPRR